MICKDCKNYEKADSQSVLQAKYNGAVSEIRRLSQKNDDLYSTFKILEDNYDRIYDENQRLIKENCDLKDPNKWGLRPTHTITTYLGKPLEYWGTLQAVNESLYDDLKKAREELEHIKRVMPARIGGWYLGKPLSYWEKLESSWSALADENADLKRHNDNLMDRIDKALDYLKP